MIKRYSIYKDENDYLNFIQDFIRTDILSTIQFINSINHHNKLIFKINFEGISIGQTYNSVKLSIKKIPLKNDFIEHNYIKYNDTILARKVAFIYYKELLAIGMIIELPYSIKLNYISSLVIDSPFLEHSVCERGIEFRNSRIYVIEIFNQSMIDLIMKNSDIKYIALNIESLIDLNIFLRYYKNIALKSLKIVLKKSWDFCLPDAHINNSAFYAKTITVSHQLSKLVYDFLSHYCDKMIIEENQRGIIRQGRRNSTLFLPFLYSVKFSKVLLQLKYRKCLQQVILTFLSQKCVIYY
jgi:hypothetical protein